MLVAIGADLLQSRRAGFSPGHVGQCRRGRDRVVKECHIGLCTAGTPSGGTEEQVWPPPHPELKRGVFG